jgi:polysaccharide biosynthesis/export protein
MTAETAVAIAGGFSPRAKRDSVTLTHTDGSGTGRFVVPPGTPISPGDTVLVSAGSENTRYYRHSGAREARAGNP